MNRLTDTLYKNNKSGCRGVFKRPYGYQAYIKVNYTHYHIGTYHDYNTAVTARKLTEYKVKQILEGVNI